MKKTLLSIIAILLGTHLFCQEATEEIKNKIKPSESFEAIEAASSLANYGYKTFSGLALFEAAQILSTINTQDLKYESFEASKPTEEGGTKFSKSLFTVANLLKDAKQYSEGDECTLIKINEFEKGLLGSTRGRLGGSGIFVGKVYAGDYDLFKVAFIEGRLAELYIKGDGDTDLDLYVYDSNGNLIEKDTDYLDQCLVRWIPLWTGNYTIKVVNRGGVYNEYVLVSN